MNAKESAAFESAAEPLPGAYMCEYKGELRNRGGCESIWGKGKKEEQAEV